MNKERTKSLWLNLAPSLREFLTTNLMVSDAVELQNATLDNFPEKPYNYHVVFAQLDKDFLSWQRWYFQCFSHQLHDHGYFFLKGYKIPNLSSGLKFFVPALLRWFLWHLATLFQNPSRQKKLLSSKFLAMAETYGLYLVAFPTELQFLKNHGIVFQKKEIAEEKKQQQLYNKDFLLKQVQTQYLDRAITNTSFSYNDIELTSVSELLAPKNSTILVLSPHPDDELVGCGGTLLALAEAGANIHVLQMTEGVTCSGLKNENEAIKRTVRWEEAKAVANGFGFIQCYWSTNTDAELINSNENRDKLHSLLHNLKPELIFVPSDLDHHPEHQVAFQLFSEVRKQYLSEIIVLKYPVWGTLNTITHAIDVTNYSQEVLEAMYLYKTAMKAEDYNARLQTLWAYQSLLVNGTSEKHVEVFSI
ncbi:GlcNAc-PI de-N-acetylase [Gelidibacter algens]|uniref:GlcNAc-PI de-N-acetylase n=1 Tax=Gelidibacter algens TaxID=49280 RepID=A0A1A7R426_9FLAO|nr:PIG-L family deacetylase [Gelidibacter algens]OBX25522.1 hypothetical protein A9996_09450 [Gelidibacter algens]RAJ22249.1 GlcNAc-PI de-N-acetylase [Gelidibacter algens]